MSKLVQQVRIVAPSPLPVLLKDAKGQLLGKPATGQQRLTSPFVREAESAGRSAFRGGMGLLQAGSPDAFATLTGSFKLLAAVVGSELVPYAAFASRQVQDLARSLQGLSKGQRAWIGLGTAIATATGGAILLAPQLLATARLLRSLGSAVVLGGGGLARLVATHPLATAGLGTASVVAGVAAYQWHRQTQQAAELADATSRQRDERTEEKIKQNTIYREMMKLPEGKRDEFLRRREAEENELYQQQQGELASRLETPGFFGRIKEGANRLFQDPEIRGLQRGMAQHQADRDLIRDIQKFRSGAFKEGPAAKQRSNDQIMRAAGLLHSFQSRVQPAYYGVEDMYKRIQLSALSESPLDAEILRIQRESFDELVKSNGTLAEIRDKVGFGIGP